MKINEAEAAISSSRRWLSTGWVLAGGYGGPNPAPPAQRDEVSQGDPDLGEAH